MFKTVFMKPFKYLNCEVIYSSLGTEECGADARVMNLCHVGSALIVELVSVKYRKQMKQMKKIRQRGKARAILSIIFDMFQKY